MNVLQVTKWYLPYAGGVEKFVGQLARGMTERGDCVRVLTCHRKRSWRSRWEEIDGVPVVRAQSFGNVLSTPLSPAFVGHYLREVRRADLVHFHVPFPLAEALHAFHGAAGRRVVVTYHADPAGSRWGGLEPLYRPVLRRFLKRADAIVTTSSAMVELATPLRGLEEKCRVIPLASSIEFERPPAGRVQEFRRRYGLRKGRTVLAVGRLVYYKGFHHLIEAVAHLEADAVIVGEGEMRVELEALVHTLGVADRVHFLGRVSDAELAACYQLADVFVLPSVAAAEAFGIVQVEALSYGLPVVNTDLPTGVPLVSRDGETGFTVPPADSVALAEALGRILHDDELRARFSRAAVRRAGDFSEERMLEAYRELYREG